MIPLSCFRGKISYYISFSYVKDKDSFSYYHNGMETNVIGYSIGLEDSSFFIPKEIQRMVRLGKYLDEGEGRSFTGKITDVNVWSRGLSSSELKRWTACQWKDQDPTPDIGRC